MVVEDETERHKAEALSLIKTPKLRPVAPEFRAKLAALQERLETLPQLSPSRQVALLLFPLQPGGAPAIQQIERRAVAARHVGLHPIADLGLQIGEVAVTLGHLVQKLLVELDLGARHHRIDAVGLVNGLAQNHAPARFSLLQEIVKPARASDVAQNTVDLRALGHDHPGLSRGALAGDVDRAFAEHVVNAHAFGVALLADLDELVGRTLKPSRLHHAVVVPHRAKTLPVARVAIGRPVLNQFANEQAFHKVGLAGHAGMAFV